MEKVVRACLVPLLLCLLMGFPDSQAQSAQCTAKLYSCNLIISTAFQNSSEWLRSFSLTALQQTCQNSSLQMCVTEVKTLCSGSDKSIVDSLQGTLDQYCSPSGGVMCQLQAYVCMKPFINMSSHAGTEMTPDKICPLFQQVQTCLKGLTSCQAALGNDTQMLDQVQQLCGSVSGFCIQSMTCFESFQHLQGNLLSNCSVLANMVQCLSSKKDVCKFKEGSVTFGNVYGAANGMCTDIAKYPTNQPGCTAAQNCLMTSKELAPISSLLTQQTGNMDMSGYMIMALNQFSNSTFVCKMFQAAAGCYVSSANTCNYTSLFVTAMTTRHQNLMSICAARTSGSGQLTSYFVQLVLTVVSGLMMAAVY